MTLANKVGTLAAVAAFTAGGVLAASGSAQAQIRPNSITRYCKYTSSQPTLRRGSHGTAVKQAQCEIDTSLRNAGLDIDGQFGPLTLAKVRKVQSCAHISVDGVIGRDTWSVLNHWSSASGWIC
jgi:zinc D-Ala-D-Ala carboxypeptidase